MGTKTQNALVKGHLEEVCKGCGARKRFQIRYGTYTKCRCVKIKAVKNECSLSKKDRDKIKRMANEIDPLKPFNSLVLNKWPKKKRRDIAGV